MTATTHPPERAENAPKPPKVRGGIGSHRWPVLVFVVVLAFVAFAVVAPGIAVLRNSLTGLDGAFTFGWYSDALTSSRVASAAGNTLIVVVGSTAMAVGIGVGLAWLISRTDLPFAKVLAVVPVMPLFFPPVVGAVAWVLLLAPNAGMLNVFLRSIFGGTEGPLSIYNVWGVTWVVGIYITPYVYLMIANAFRQYDAAYEEAARTAGVPMMSVMRRITLPMLKPAIMAGGLLAFVSALAQFSIPAIVGKTGQVYVFTTLIYDMLRKYPREMEPAAVLSAFMVIVTVFVLWYQRRLLRKSSRFVTLSGKGVKRTKLPLGRWRWPIFAAIIAYITLTVILPALALINMSLRKYWSADVSLSDLTGENYAAIFDGYTYAMSSIVNSLELSFIGATVGMLLCVLIAYTVVRSKIKGRGFLDYMAMLPAAIPATVLGAGLLMIYLGPPIALYGTNLLLLIAYVANFLPQGTRTTTAAFHQVSPEMDEAAYVCGASWLTTFRRIAIPLIGPAVAGGWIFLFVLMSREVSASALIASPQTPVISVAILEMWGTGDIGRLAAFSTVVFGLSTLMTVFVLRFGRGAGAQ